MAWAIGVTTTLTGTTSTLTSDTITTPKKFNTVLIHEFVGTVGDYLTNTLNADTGSLYADRYSRNGGADSTQTSQAKMLINSSYEESQSFTVMLSCWISGEEKLIISHQVGYITAGAGTAPNRYEVVNKYVPSPLTDTFDTIEIDSANTTATFLIDSNISVLGSD
jgi:hypothetical protein